MGDMRAGRWTHRHSGELVVFLIGTTVNRPWHPDLRAPVFQAMPRMLIEPASDPDSGLLGYPMTIARGGSLLVQYWSSTEKLYA